MLVAAYIRVSSRSQDYDTQKDAIERAASARGDKIALWCAEKRRGETKLRPELDALIARVHRGEIRRVYVFRLDRVTRGGMRDMFAIVDGLRARGCALVSTAEPWLDLEGPFAELVCAVLGWAAQQELRAIGDRISAARTRMKRQGKRWGRPARCDRDTVQAIDRLAASGKSQRDIARALKVKRPTIASVLARKGAYERIPRAAEKQPSDPRHIPPAK